MSVRVFNPLTGKLEEKNKVVKNFKVTESGDLQIVVPKGERGDTGPMGPQGLPGLNSKDGESIVGPMGPQGKQGERGADGKSIVGPMGPPGKDGVDGNSIVGPPGKDGIDGKSNLILKSNQKPNDSLGLNGDWCFTDLNEIFFKKDNKWQFYTQISSGYSRKAIISMINDFGGILNLDGGQPQDTFSELVPINGGTP